MLEDNLVHKGDVARVLKTVWLYQGKVAADAFVLRPRLKEDYVSVLREGHFDFLSDLCAVCKKTIDCTYASLAIPQIERLDLPELAPNHIKYMVSLVDNQRLKSHAGIFVSVNDEILVGGKPLSNYLVAGQSQSSAIMLVQLKLAKLAEKNIKRLLLSTSLNEGMVSDPLK